MIINSGENQYHGALYEYFRNEDLNANNFFRNQANALAGSNSIAPRPFVNANQYAGSIGGPIKKD